jgi:uncharacterized protein YjbI with pentapeptide repeats
VANREQLDILRKGPEIWNTWREEHRKLRIDLSGANLRNANLSGADLREVDLCSANLSRARLVGAYLREAMLKEATPIGAYLREANLYGVNLREANLYSADLSNASLIGADLSGAYLGEADLSGADLNEASLIGADLRGATLNRTSIGSTIFANIDLRSVKGLDTVKHLGPSTIGIDTLLRSQGDIPEVFLRGAGLDDTFISYAHSLVQNPVDYYTCFISYSSRDQDFAERLYADLQDKGVRCWFAPEDMKTGDKIRYRIDESIRLYDKLLLVLSAHSVASQWVEHEVEAAIGKELEGKPNVLFPVRLDDTVMHCKIGWASHIRLTRHITDFSHWKDHDSYQKSLHRLLRDLKAGTG